MNAFTVKRVLAKVLDILRWNDRMLQRLNLEYQNNYIRIINYHDTPQEVSANLENHLKWYREHFENVDEEKLGRFLDGSYSFVDKPGILLSFDDGLAGNASVAAPLLERYGFTGFFFVSSDFISTEGYVTWDEVKNLLKKGHVIGCHTATHHRMEEGDSAELLYHEIIESREILESHLERKIDSFCWCGGEEEHYTGKAAELIKDAGYKYAFMTNSFPVLPGTNRLQLERINVDAAWSLPLMRFQISGWMDRRLAKKRKRVEELTK